MQYVHNISIRVNNFNSSDTVYKSKFKYPLRVKIIWVLVKPKKQDRYVYPMMISTSLFEIWEMRADNGIRLKPSWVNSVALFLVRGFPSHPRHAHLQLLEGMPSGTPASLHIVCPPSKSFLGIWVDAFMNLWALHSACLQNRHYVARTLLAQYIGRYLNYDCSFWVPGWLSLVNHILRKQLPSYLCQPARCSGGAQEKIL